jgi:transcription elongation factor GreA
MKLTLARRALSVIPPEDLRVLKAVDPKKLKKLIKQEPAEVVFQALRMLKGEATTQELRRNLTGQAIIAPSSWAGWWKEARSAIESDDRIDLTQSFRQLYRLRGEAGDEDTLLALPVIEPRRGIRPNINLIRRFLEQHPDETSRAARVYTPIIERWARDEKTSAEDRLAVHLQLFRWRREVQDDFVEALRFCLKSGVEMSAYSDIEDQKLLARVAAESEEDWRMGCLFALSSRSAEIRGIARERMRREPDEARSAINDLMHDPSSRSLAALTVIEMTLEEPVEPFASDPWRAALAAVLLVDTATKEQIRTQALGLLSQGGRLLIKARGGVLEEGTKEGWAVVLRRWRTSERYLKPVLEFLKESGNTDLVDEVQNHRTERTERMLGRGGKSAESMYGGHLMTRATYQKLLHERNGLIWELKNTIPEVIRKAREMGDLRENAEYDAAKHKQADYAHRVMELSQRLGEAKRIEELRSPPGESAPGTEIHAVDVGTNEERVFWLLGEGDDWLGSNVISYATPLGRSFLGKKPGDRVSVVGTDIVHDYVIREVTHKLPETEETSEEVKVTEDDLKVIADIEAESGES